jgi:hydroxyethylthiazole kinase-like uncharacterized protein yjeF
MTRTERTTSRRLSKVPTLPRRRRDGHKGDFGRVLVIAGSVDMPGAALLATLGALRGGAGLVTLAAVSEIVPWLVGSAPSAMFIRLPATPSGGIAERALERVLERIEASDAVALGPGLGRDPETVRFVKSIVARSTKPIVLDADGLNAYEANALLLAGRRCKLVVTPHPGEFVRLTGGAVPRSDRDRRAGAEDLARRIGPDSVVVLKGDRTIVTDGSSTYVNSTGNPGMATGGAGDVLTGLIAALLAVAPPLHAAAIGVHAHGLAGDLAVRHGSETSLIATDLIAALPLAFRKVEGRPRR